MDDAERIRAQFDAFVRALSRAADRIAAAREPTRVGAGPEGDGRARPGAIAA